MEILNNFMWLVIGVIMAIVIPVIKQTLRNKVQRNRIKFFVHKEKDFDWLSLELQDKSGSIHFLVNDDDFENFGIDHNEIESLNKSLKKGESKRVYLDVE